jgi:pyruvate/2-oxoglutarate dehydrogenase complex dihydrolipoamide acyltransferase (E2) component
MPNVVLRRMQNPSSFRRIAAAAWPLPDDATIHGHLEIRAERLLAWLEAEQQKSGVKLSVTHAVARALALVLGRHPDLNGLVRWGGIWLRQSVDIFLQVAIPAEDGRLGTADLSGVKLRSVDGMSISQISDALRQKASAIREGKDAEFKKTKGTLDIVPSFLLRPLLLLLDFLQFGLNLDLRWAGLPKDPFGSAMVTSVGMFGIRVGYAPIFPLARCPILLLVGAVEEKPLVEDGALKVGKVLNLSGSFDHRMVDGYQAGKLAGEIKTLLEEPEGLGI